MLIERKELSDDIVYDRQKTIWSILQGNYINDPLNSFVTSIIGNGRWNESFCGSLYENCEDLTNLTIDDLTPNKIKLLYKQFKSKNNIYICNLMNPILNINLTNQTPQVRCGLIQRYDYEGLLDKFNKLVFNYVKYPYVDSFRSYILNNLINKLNLENPNEAFNLYGWEALVIKLLLKNESEQFAKDLFKLDVINGVDISSIPKFKDIEKLKPQKILNIRKFDFNLELSNSEPIFDVTDPKLVSLIKTQPFHNGYYIYPNGGFDLIKNTTNKFVWKIWNEPNLLNQLKMLKNYVSNHGNTIRVDNRIYILKSEFELNLWCGNVKRNYQTGFYEVKDYVYLINYIAETCGNKKNCSIICSKYYIPEIYYESIKRNINDQTLLYVLYIIMYQQTGDLMFYNKLKNISPIFDTKKYLATANIPTTKLKRLTKFELNSNLDINNPMVQYSNEFLNELANTGYMDIRKLPKLMIARFIASEHHRLYGPPHLKIIVN